MKILLITLIALSSSTLAQIGPPKDHFTPAVIDGDLAAVQAFLDKGVSANARSFQGGSPLMYAVTHNRLEIAKLLINNGADINFRYNGKTLLHLAAEKEKYYSLQKAVSLNLFRVLNSTMAKGLPFPPPAPPLPCRATVYYAPKCYGVSSPPPSRCRRPHSTSPQYRGPFTALL